MIMSLVGNWLRVKAPAFMTRVSSRRGQNTVEYLLMLSVIAVVAVIAGNYLKGYMPQLLSKVTDQISGSTASQ